ncbi:MULTISPECIES: DUF1488 domain-containing protein [Pectobacterium]|uniref:DUF1488 domain-containing protein n=2 Tax=Pectobacterium TaxID=122277 RepID=A0AAP9IGK8_9GAMM|nr:MULTISPECIES: DUF1488 domain-containing protein [Pectobacterium]ASY81023.1 hypothetical protein BJK05_13920 [Pectobacterium polaris]KHS98473.1 hypothetical protein RC88_02920 [Pectobacterium parvum]MBW5893911.1 DUF1488 domain-containing protein [Pectobacterium polaris]QHQ24317.1 DUF1488 family protein [Pectobacterium parvum]
MNQAIQFPDRESWDDKVMAIRFPVLVNGFQQECLVSAGQLQQRYGGDSPERWLALFREYRWDLEDELEQMIVAEEWDDEGCYSLS